MKSKLLALVARLLFLHSASDLALVLGIILLPFWHHSHVH